MTMMMTDSEPSLAAMTTDQLAAELKQRVTALYRLNRELAEHCDRLGKVVDAARSWSKGGAPYTTQALLSALTVYEQQMAQLARERG